MASTNEDAVALATAAFEDGRILIMRHLPDRGTIEIGWWRRDEGGLAQAPGVLELAAEEPELRAFRRLCSQAQGTDTQGKAREGEELAASDPLGDGAQLLALRAGDELKLMRRPEASDGLALSAAALDRLVSELVPAAMQKLDTLGFGQIQQES